MKLLRLKLENFRQHLATDINFSDGMTAIVGPNGTGKTTVLEAITFALFGDSRGRVDDIRFYWAEPRKKYLARLTFQIGDRTFEVERSTYDASLKEVSAGVESEKVWATGKVETTRRCEQVLGLTYEQFINSFCAEQKALRFLDFKENRERQAEVARMLGYDRLELAEHLATERRKDSARQRTWMESTLRDAAELEAERQLATTRLSDATQRAESAKKLKAEAESSLPQLTEAATRAQTWLRLAAEMDVIAGKADGLKTNVKSTGDALAETEKEVAELATLKLVEEEYQALCKQIEVATAAYQKELQRTELLNQREARLKEVRELCDQLEKAPVPDLKAFEKLIQDAITSHSKAQSACEASMDAWTGERLKAQTGLSEAKAIWARAKQDWATAEDMISKGQCPECGQPITASYENILATRRKAAEEAEKAVTAGTAAVATSEQKPESVTVAERALADTVATHRQRQANLEEARRAADKAGHVKEQLTLAQQRLKLLEDQISSLPADQPGVDLNALKAKLALLEPGHSRYLALRNVADKLQVCRERHDLAKKEHDEARAKFQALGKERQALGFATREEAMAGEEALRSLKARLDLLDKDILLAAQEEASAKKELDLAAKAIAERKAKQKEIAALNQKEVLHGATSAELKALRLQLNAELGPELEARAGENISLLTNGRYGKIALDKNFAATLFEDDDTHKPVISGGEEDVVALSLRLALSELIQERQGRPMSLLILDEVFGSLDVDRRQSVMDRLASLKGRFEQILVISHIEEINQVADQCLYLSRDAQTRSTRVSDAPLSEFPELL
jgi:exonuclease SbcC